MRRTELKTEEKQGCCVYADKRKDVKESCCMIKTKQRC